MSQFCFCFFFYINSTNNGSSKNKYAAAASIDLHDQQIWLILVWAHIMFHVHNTTGEHQRNSGRHVNIFHHTENLPRDEPSWIVNFKAVFEIVVFEMKTVWVQMTKSSHTVWRVYWSSLPTQLEMFIFITLTINLKKLVLQLCFLNYYFLKNLIHLKKKKNYLDKYSILMWLWTKCNIIQYVHIVLCHVLYGLGLRLSYFVIHTFWWPV